MKSKKILLGLLQALLALAALLAIPGCETDDDIKVAKPKDDVSGLPWDRPQAGEDAQRLGGLPQSH
jgi:hypothetical protein